MKITDLKLALVRWDIPKAEHACGNRTIGASQTTQLGVLTVETDSGVQGHSFLGGARQGADHFAKPLFQYLKPMVMDRNPLDIGSIWQDMYHKANRLASLRAIGAIDVALWDIAGKVAGLPIHRLLGSHRDTAPAYASSAWLPSLEAYAEEAISFLERGWTAYKIHPHGIPSSDIEITEGVRRAVGDEVVLMLDSMWAYTYEDALRVGRVAEANDYTGAKTL